MTTSTPLITIALLQFLSGCGGTHSHDTADMGCEWSTELVSPTSEHISADLSGLEDLKVTSTANGHWYDGTEQSIDVTISAVTDEVSLSLLDENKFHYCYDMYNIYIDYSIDGGDGIAATGRAIQRSLHLTESPDDYFFLYEIELSPTGDLLTLLEAYQGDWPGPLGDYEYYIAAWVNVGVDGTFNTFDIRAVPQLDPDVYTDWDGDSIFTLSTE